MSRNTVGNSEFEEGRNEVVEALKRKRETLQDPIPDRVVVRKSAGLFGSIEAPPSKSYSHRALMVAGLSPTTTTVHNPLISDDIFATINAWQALGAKMAYDDVTNSINVTGVQRPFAQGNIPSEIFVKESGTTLRFLLPGLAFAKGTVRVNGQHSLKKRPNSIVVDPLKQLGINVESTAPDDRVPITVRGGGFLPSGNVQISGGMSSQVISSFLLWLPLASNPPRASSSVFDRFRSQLKDPFSTIKVVGNLVSRPYVDITIDVLQWAQVKIEVVQPGALYRVPGNQRFSPSEKVFSVNGDYSSAAFFLVAASLVESDVLVQGLKADKQGDRAIVRILQQMGANIDDSMSTGIRVKGAAPLHGIELDCADIPDLVPILCVLGLFAEGQTVLKNISHLRYKETDRLKGPTEELRRLGARIDHTENSITIHKSQLVCDRVSARGDHRLAMSLIVAGLAGAGAEVDEAPCIKKSYPGFLRHIRSLGAEIFG